MLGQRDNMSQKTIQGQMYLPLRSVFQMVLSTLEMGHTQVVHFLQTNASREIFSV